MTTTNRMKETGLSLGSIVSAIAATCCLLPISLSALGVSVSFLGAYSEFIETYEIYAFIIAFIFLGLGFYMAFYRNQGGKVQKTILWISLGLVLIAVGYEVFEHFLAGEEEASILQRLL